MWPSGHGVQVIDPRGSSLNVPEGHNLQIVPDAAYDPELHAVQNNAPCCEVT